MRRLLPLALGTLAACSSEPAPAPSPAPTATVATPRTLIAADLDLAKLGAKIAGPKGTDPEFSVMAGGKVVARITAFVACPQRVSSCTPQTLPADTIYTYVLRVTPDVAGPMAPAPSQDINPKSPPASPSAADSVAEVPATLFRTTRTARGFNGGVGFVRAEAEAALGVAEPIRVTLDDGQLIWRVSKGSGWKPSAPITFWWQSTAAPDGPVQAYRLEMGDTGWTANGPFPGANEEEGADNAVEGAPPR